MQARIKEKERCQGHMWWLKARYFSVGDTGGLEMRQDTRNSAFLIERALEGRLKTMCQWFTGCEKGRTDSCNGNVAYLHSGSTGLDSRQGHQLSWLAVFVAFSLQANFAVHHSPRCSAEVKNRQNSASTSCFEGVLLHRVRLNPCDRLCHSSFRRLVADFPQRLSGFESGSSHVGFVVNKVALWQVFSMYNGFS
jgi:hypothetical protein